MCIPTCHVIAAPAAPAAAAVLPGSPPGPPRLRQRMRSSILLKFSVHPQNCLHVGLLDIAAGLVYLHGPVSDASVACNGRRDCKKSWECRQGRSTVAEVYLADCAACSCRPSPPALPQVSAAACSSVAPCDLAAAAAASAAAPAAEADAGSETELRRWCTSRQRASLHQQCRWDPIKHGA